MIAHMSVCAPVQFHKGLKGFQDRMHARAPAMWPSTRRRWEHGCRTQLARHAPRCALSIPCQTSLALTSRYIRFVNGMNHWPAATTRSSSYGPRKTGQVHSGRTKANRQDGPKLDPQPMRGRSNRAILGFAEMGRQEAIGGFSATVSASLSDLAAQLC